MPVRFTYGKRKPFKIGSASRITSSRRAAIVQKIEQLLNASPKLVHIVGEISHWTYPVNDGRLIATCIDAAGHFSVLHVATGIVSILSFRELTNTYVPVKK